MTELRYDVIVSGNLLEGFTLEGVTRNLIERLELTEKKIEQLFRQKHAVLASNLDFDKASEYLEHLTTAGADSYLIRHGHAVTTGTTNPMASASETVRYKTVEKETAAKEAEASAIDAEQQRTLPITFNGNGAEYFRIWIVNVVLTILTLGIYSAWAKVRNKQYFYGNTLLDGASFVYRAEPLQILKGRLIAFAFFAGYILSSSLFPGIELLFGLVFFFAFPWLVIKSLAFNAHYSEYRNVNFGFDGKYAEAWGAFVGWPIIALLSLGLLFPYVAYKQQTFMMRHHRYGDTHFAFEPGVAAYYIIFLMMLGIAFVASILIAVSSAILSAIGNPQVSVVMAGLLSIAMYLFMFVFYSVKVTNLRYNSTTIGPHGFHAFLQAPSYLWLVFFNTLLTVMTLGLFLPWAKVRVAQYHADHLNMQVQGDLNQFSSEMEQRVGSFGEGMADVFDLDIGL